jgi:predicted metalloendopeptidase
LQDYEQRWILCSNIVTNVAPVAVGHLYTSSYFAEQDKAKADELLNSILEEYIDTIKNSTWMDSSTKQSALEKTSKMKKYIGYHVKLRTSEAEKYYDELPEFSEESFLETGLSFLVLSTDREFKRLHAKKKAGEDSEDWTK